MKEMKKMFMLSTRGDMAQWLRELIALPEDLSLVPNTQTRQFITPGL